jgi:hypothetical protein
MRIRTMAGLVVAGAAATGAIVGGVAYAAADDTSEPIVRIVEQEAPAENAAENAVRQEVQQPEKNCPETDGAQPSQAGL